MLVYTDIERALRLLVSIYRPHNFYCIHVDRKSPVEYRTILMGAAVLIGNNVHVVPEEESLRVVWGTMSTLDADLLCSKILLKFSTRWKYWINLTGQEFPLRTNWELVVALKALNGTNVAAGHTYYRYPERRPSEKMMDFKINWMKGSAHIALRRDFVEMMHSDIRCQKVLNALRMWESILKWTVIADEQYFCTLNNNPTVIPMPGAYLGGNRSNEKTPLITRLKLWEKKGRFCQDGHLIRSICMLGMTHLPILLSSPHFFANKFLPHIEPTAYDLLENWIRTKVEYERTYHQLHPSFNRNYYSRLEMSWNHI
ncbi:unnamed protein product [Calicophoron daubneyi]|uniref:Beta-1,3-galactosyl-O-glycosyl-glycoprotein beta-1,6-N-acetylglucosaminyltransferase n=1 Tax=Calicophoron daubneyi TaxID=300641 RepID=A0AAV2T6Z0_CALDB